MFEQEIEHIMNLHKESIKLLKKLHSVYNDYDFGGTKRDEIYYLNIKIESVENVENRTREYLNDILKNRNFQTPSLYADKRTIEQIIQDTKKVTIDDFYYNLVRYIPRGHIKYDLSNMIYTEDKVNYSSLGLILDCIYLLGEKEPMPRDLYNNATKRAKSGEPFLFKGCKITHYKNGNLKIQFSNAKLFSDFEDNFNKALIIAVENSRKGIEQ